MKDLLANLGLSWGMLVLALITVAGWAIQASITYRLSRKLSEHRQAQETRDTLIGQQIQLPPAVIERRIEAVAEVWDIFCKCRENPPTVFMAAVDLMTTKELEERVSKANFARGIRSDLSGSKLTEWLKQYHAEQFRPFIVEESFILWHTYRAVIGRSAYLLLESLKTGKARHWFVDPFTKRLMERCLSMQEIEKLGTYKIGQQRRFKEAIEAKLLASLKRTLAGNTKEDFKQVSETLSSSEILRGDDPTVEELVSET